MKSPGLPALQRAVDRAAGEPVAVLRAPRDDEARIEPEAPQDGDQEGRAADPVDVVVAEDHDLLPREDGGPQPRRRGDRGCPQERVLQLARARACRNSAASAGSRVPRADEELGDDRADARAPAQLLGLAGRDRRVDPEHRAVGHDYCDALLEPVHSYFGATSEWASTCFRSPLCHQ